MSLQDLHTTDMYAFKSQTMGTKKESCGAAYDGITQDELDFSLKRKLRMTPEQRYQRKTSNFLYHDLSCYMRKPGEEDHGCTGTGCIPECRFYPETDRIEDEKVIEEHSKLVESYRQKNAIVEPPSGV